MGSRRRKGAKRRARSRSSPPRTQPRKEAPTGIDKLAATEAAYLKSAEAELDALHVAQEASVALVSIIDRFSIESVEYNTTEGRTKLAVATLATIAFRSARACIVIIAAGYVPEAFGLKRRVSEIRWRMETIVDDHSGESARQFIEGRVSPPRKLASKLGALEAWDAYSTGAHADVDGTPAFTQVLGPDGMAAGLPLGGSRQPEPANHMLVELATELRAMAEITARVVREGQLGPTELLQKLDAEIAERAARWYGSHSHT